jgi:DNA repair exonuclease SbcCD ATPase subunit
MNKMETDYGKRFKNLITKREKLREFYLNERGKRDMLESQIHRTEANIVESQEKIDRLEKVRALLQRVSEVARDQARVKIENIVTNCLQYIFDSDIQFNIDISEVRGRPEAEFYVLSRIDGEVISTRPQEARGGGVVDIISLAVRIAMLESGYPRIQGPLILDEPAKHVSDEYIVNVAEFLKQVSTMFDRQIIMVTHNRHLSEVADKSIRVEMSHGVSRVFFDS